LRFNQKSFDDNDAIGKELLMAFLRSKGHNISENSDKYAVDLVSDKNGKSYYWEVEMKSQRPWTNREDFPFLSVSFLSRKEKWKEQHFWYVIICKETKAAIFCNSDIIFNENYKQKLYIKTNDRTGLDNFYRVPKELCIFVRPEEFVDER
jgi:hypothetical protein